MRLTRRTASVGVIAISTVLMTSLPAAAGSPVLFGDLEEYLEAAQLADYAGQQLVVTVFEGSTTAGILGIEHAANTFMVGDGTTEAVVGGGKVKSAQPVLLSSYTQLGASDRYTTAPPRDVRRLGRSAREVDVLEGTQLRARLVFDVETGAPLSTRVFDGDGGIFRLSSMIDFDPRPRKIYDSNGYDSREYEVIMPASVDGLDTDVAGYRLGDRYAGPDDVYHTFYSDGLFSFSLFEVAGSVRADTFDDATTVQYGGSKYKVFVTPSQMWVKWTTPGTTYVLVGDLPPDHLEDVLGELPRPRKRSFFSGVWRRFFG